MRPRPGGHLIWIIVGLFSYINSIKGQRIGDGRQLNEIMLKLTDVLDWIQRFSGTDIMFHVTPRPKPFTLINDKTELMMNRPPKLILDAFRLSLEPSTMLGAINFPLSTLSATKLQSTPKRIFKFHLRAT